MRVSDGLLFIHRQNDYTSPFYWRRIPLSTEDGTLLIVDAVFVGLFGAKSEIHLTTTPVRESHLLNLPGQLRPISLVLAHRIHARFYSMRS